MRRDDHALDTERGRRHRRRGAARRRRRRPARSRPGRFLARSSAAARRWRRSRPRSHDCERGFRHAEAGRLGDARDGVRRGVRGRAACGRPGSSPGSAGRAPGSRPSPWPRMPPRPYAAGPGTAPALRGPTWMQPARVDVGDRAAAGADRVDVDRRRDDGQAPLDLELAPLADGAVVHEPDVGARTTDVERDAARLACGGGEVGAAEGAAREPGAGASSPAPARRSRGCPCRRSTSA